MPVRLGTRRVLSEILREVLTGNTRKKRRRQHRGQYGFVQRRRRVSQSGLGSFRE